MSFINLITGGITGLVGKYFDNKAAESDAKHTRKLTRINNTASWETTAVGQMAKSFKDEWFMFVFSLPLVAIFISPFVDLVMVGEYTQGCLQTAALSGIAGLKQAPDWYCYVLGMQVGASFGVKGAGEIVNKLRK